MWGSFLVGISTKKAWILLIEWRFFFRLLGMRVYRLSLAWESWLLLRFYLVYWWLHYVSVLIRFYNVRWLLGNVGFGSLLGYCCMEWFLRTSLILVKVIELTAVVLLWILNIIILISLTLKTGTITTVIILIIWRVNQMLQKLWLIRRFSFRLVCGLEHLSMKVTNYF